MTGCGNLGFSPQVSVQPTADLADTPSGLDVSLDFAFDEGLLNPAGLAQSETKKLILAPSEGIIVNPEASEDLVGCSPDELAQETVDSLPGDGCPLGSEVGTIEVETPLLPGTILEGQVFAAQPDDPTTPAPGAENPFDSPLAIYVVVRSSPLGILVKQAGNIEFDPAAEQLTAVFDDLPQLPISRLELHLSEGDGAPLLTPVECGQFTSEATLAPWSDPSSQIVATSPFEIVAGPDGGPCPSGEEPPVDPGEEGTSPSFDSPSSNSQPSPAPPPGSGSPIGLRPCPKGKRRAVPGKARCVRRRCRRVKVGKKALRRCSRPQARRPRQRPPS